MINFSNGSMGAIGYGKFQAKFPGDPTGNKQSLHLSSTKVEPSFAIALSYQQHHMNKNLHLPVENFVHGELTGLRIETSL